MKVGLIDVDGHNFPNLALMKLSAWHKANGDQVEWYEPMFSGRMDVVYMSKVFTFTPDYEYYIDAETVIRGGGTGYKKYEQNLTEEIEGCFPDYSIYPKCDYAIGFLTRGCVRKCPWCVVPKKEGYIHDVNIWQNIKRPDSKKILFLDNNVLASEHGRKQIVEMSGRKDIKIDFNQGLDARLIDNDIAEYLSKCNWNTFLRMACDTTQMLTPVTQAIEKLKQCGLNPRKIFIYILVQNIDDALERINELDKQKVEVFAQPYRDFENNCVDPQAKHFARWVNNKAVFRTCNWEDYHGRLDK